MRQCCGKRYPPSSTSLNRCSRLDSVSVIHRGQIIPLSHKEHGHFCSFDPWPGVVCDLVMIIIYSPYVVHQHIIQYNILPIPLKNSSSALLYVFTLDILVLHLVKFKVVLGGKTKPLPFQKRSLLVDFHKSSS